MKYFAYGSNMSSRRLLSRVPSAEVVGTGILAAHQLRFHKAGRSDQSAKCDAFATWVDSHAVHGVVYDINPLHKADLDRVEGVGAGYEAKDVHIRLTDGAWTEAFTYYATDIDTSLRPHRWYCEHVLRGALEHGLPRGYVALIEAVDALDDPDAARHERELLIYG